MPQTFCRHCGAALTPDGSCPTCVTGEEKARRETPTIEEAAPPLTPTLQVDPDQLAGLATSPEPSTALDPLVGQILADRFLVQGLIGRGGDRKSVV